MGEGGLAAAVTKVEELTGKYEEGGASGVRGTVVVVISTGAVIMTIVGFVVSLRGRTMT